jgi:hypothetical protein
VESVPVHLYDDLVLGKRKVHSADHPCLIPDHVLSFRNGKPFGDEKAGEPPLECALGYCPWLPFFDESSQGPGSRDAFRADAI